jgi:hypothetical protein
VHHHDDGVRIGGKRELGVEAERGGREPLPVKCSGARLRIARAVSLSATSGDRGPTADIHLRRGTGLLQHCPLILAAPLVTRPSAGWHIARDYARARAARVHFSVGARPGPIR